MWLCIRPHMVMLEAAMLLPWILSGHKPRFKVHFHSQTLKEDILGYLLCYSQLNLCLLINSTMRFSLSNQVSNICSRKKRHLHSCWPFSHYKKIPICLNYELTSRLLQHMAVNLRLLENWSYLLSVEVSTTAGWELSLGSSVNTSWLLLIFSACQHTEIVPLLPITDLIQLQFSSNTWWPNKATTDLASEHTKSYLYCWPNSQAQQAGPCLAPPSPLHYSPTTPLMTCLTDHVYSDTNPHHFTHGLLNMSSECPHILRNV